METDDTESKRLAAEEKRKRWEEATRPRMTEIVPGLFLGNIGSSWSRDLLQGNRTNAIVSLTTARWVWWNEAGSTRRAGVSKERHKWVQCADSSTQDLLVYMSDICDFIDEVAAPSLQSSSALPTEAENLLDNQPRDEPQHGILVHCDQARSRSPTIIIAYLMRKYGAKREDALSFVLSKQKVRPSANFTRQLEVWEQVQYQLWEISERTIPKPQYQAFLDDRAAPLREKGLTWNEPLVPLTL
ncbi:dual specificity phosphatase [Aspergillus karnatakaensis]|uniref:uncharacterized protein n=1 Tax=Aspergillus karnatakaensis TaxID=1810916 RepID=UPI003CCE18F7